MKTVLKISQLAELLNKTEESTLVIKDRIEEIVQYNTATDEIMLLLWSNGPEKTLNLLGTTELYSNCFAATSYYKGKEKLRHKMLVDSEVDNAFYKYVKSVAVRADVNKTIARIIK